VMLRDFIARYPVPHTVSVIQGETGGTGLYAALSPALEDIARRIFALPQVEAASHSYSHPFNWNAALAGLTDRPYGLPIPGYRVDLDTEIGGSIRYIDDRLMPPGRRAGVFLWTGDCVPPASAIARTWSEGLLNMNGGETTITRSNPSLTAVAPLSLRKSGWLQVLAPNQNENVYTNLWTGPFWGFERVIETFEMTERPRRLKPVNIYYHTYSASKPASIAALRRVYDWAMGQSLHPVSGSAWILKVVDFEGFAVARDLRRPGVWKLVGDGALRTVRLPDTVAPSIDWVRSLGVAGSHHGADGRYLHLSAPVAWLVPSAGEPVPAPIVLEANGRIDAVVRDANGLSFRFSPAVAGELVLSHSVSCRVSIGGRPAVGRRSTTTDPLQSGHDAHQYDTQADRSAGGVLVSVGCP
jgi:polysaccharide biosynthesis protein PelA